MGGDTLYNMWRQCHRTSRVCDNLAEKSDFIMTEGVSGMDDLIFNLGISLAYIALKEAHVFHRSVRKCEPERVTGASNPSYTH